MKSRANSNDRRSAAQMHALAAVRRDIRSHGSTGPRKYLCEFKQAFRTYECVMSEADLTAKLAASSTILIGDYHALPASQQFAASVIERLTSSRRVVLGVEALLARDQSVLDAWWRREISEEAFRERLRFDREWGYRWTPFYELLTAARDRAEGLYGLDCLPRHDMRRIRSRDRHAAEKIAEMRARHPKAALVVLFGESHLAPEHLPRSLTHALPNESVLTVLQNLDSIYWQAADENAAAVCLSDDVVCVFNATPLEKYEGYRLCLEKWHGDNDDAPDFTPAIHNLILSLARTLGFRSDSPHNGTQPKYLADSLPEVAHIADPETSALDNQTKAALEERGCFYAPQSNTFFIREFSMTAVAGEAARFLHHACKGMESYAPSERETTLANFGSRLLCPATRDFASLSSKGEALYCDYVEGKITRAQVRRMFLAK